MYFIKVSLLFHFFCLLFIQVVDPSPIAIRNFFVNRAHIRSIFSYVRRVCFVSEGESVLLPTSYLEVLRAILLCDCYYFFLDVFVSHLFSSMFLNQVFLNSLLQAHASALHLFLNLSHVHVDRLLHVRVRLVQLLLFLLDA